MSEIILPGEGECRLATSAQNSWVQLRI
ncbi:hypothetical protein A2U01_0050838, partial [Trifolium medium]|nr:hypothetical protein [Trifolium medium]